ncbi:MAG: transglutaminase family protein [Proteobacteria bacterium]|nr:transglutaminase family protein [Pseudomonadota bacterium]
MKLDIAQDMAYRYDAPVRSSTQYLRLTPRESPRHRVLHWQIDTPRAATQTHDGYGNVLHVLTLDKSVSEIRIRAHGVVELRPAADGAPGDPVTDLDGALSPLVFLRTTPITRADEALAAFAERHRKRAGALAGLRELAAAIADRMPLKPDEGSGAGSAAEAFAGGVVSARDQAHVFIACCRHLGVPARFVSGYLHSSKVASEGTIAGHAWAEAWTGNQWRGFDLASRRADGEGHLALAIGADYLDACPIRGVRTGGGIETLEVSARIRITQ